MHNNHKDNIHSIARTSLQARNEAYSEEEIECLLNASINHDIALYFHHLLLLMRKVITITASNHLLVVVPRLISH